jgi:hypothetical protein
MKLSNSFAAAAALVAVLISPTIGSATDDLTFNAEEPASPSTSMYDLIQKSDKNKGRLIEVYTTVYIATDEDLEDSESPDSLALSFLEDALVYAYNKVQEDKSDLQGAGSDLHAISSHFLGKATAPDDPDGDVLFPELSENLRGSVGRYAYSS